MVSSRVLLFDWDNTLVDSWELLHESMNAALEGLGRERWTLRETQLRVGPSLRETFPSLFQEDAATAQRLYLSHFHKHHLSRLRPLPGVEGLLRFFSAQPIRVGVLSNKTGTTLRSEVAHLGWQKYFDIVVGAGDASADKPDKAVLLYLFAELGLQLPREFVYVGDAPIDMRLARAGGGIGVLFSTASPCARFAEAAPHHHCADIASLRSTLRALLLD